MEDVEIQEAQYGRGDYIIGTDHRDFCSVCISDTRVSTDHRMILDEKMGDGVRIKRKYCKGRTTWPIVSSKGVPIREEDSIFNDLQKEVHKSTLTVWDK